MTTSRNESVKLLSESDGKRIVDKALSHLAPDAHVQVSVMSFWSSGSRWARNKATMTSDHRDIIVSVVRNPGRATSTAYTNQIDDESIKGVTESADYYARINQNPEEPPTGFSPRIYALNTGNVWSDTTYNRDPRENSDLISKLVKESVKRDFISAGYIESYAGSLTVFERNEWGFESIRFARLTQAQCSATVRTKNGTASGWAGESSYEIDHLNEADIASRALEKCIASLDPVRIEPGRYTTILEPAASASMFRILVSSLHRVPPEAGRGPYALGYDDALNRIRSKLGLKIVDERISISHDPFDTRLGTVAYPAVEKIRYIEKGILTTLTNTFDHAPSELVEDRVSMMRNSFRVESGDTSLDEMISSTQMGLLVTRLNGLELLDPQSMLYTGLTRDGLWLIQNGVITKPVRNFRFTESPLFIFNNVEQLGESVPVFNPENRREVLLHQSHNAIASIIVPAVKVNDFSFTSTVDAI